MFARLENPNFVREPSVEQRLGRGTAAYYEEENKEKAWKQAQGKGAATRGKVTKKGFLGIHSMGLFVEYTTELAVGPPTSANLYLAR